MSGRALAAEFLGTFVLCFLGIGAACADGAGLVGVALAHGLAIATMGTAVGHISGGHFNPAVSFAMALTKRMKWGDMATYWMAQLLGGAAGAYSVFFLYPKDKVDAVSLGSTMVNPAIDPTKAIVFEAIGTAILVWAIFGTAVRKGSPNMGAWFIGLTISAVIFAVGPLTGAALNPARWFGPVAVTHDFKDAIVYIIGPCLGAAIAALSYQKFLCPEMDSETA
ncbi:MAG: aquaporin [Fimbriimonadaceae bacterium]